MNETQSYKELLVWQKGISIAKIYQRVPGRRKIRAHLTDATCGSLHFIEHRRRPSAPYHGRVRPIHLARGRLRRGLDTQLIVAVDLAFCTKHEALPIYEAIDELRRMLNSLRRKLVTRTSHCSLITCHF